MDLTYSSEETMFKDSVDSYVRDYQRAASTTAPCGFRREALVDMAELGWLAASFPEAVGGFGGSAIETMIIHEGIGSGLIVEPVLTTVLAARLLTLADPARAADIVPSLLSGETLACVAHSEAPARGDVSFVEARIQAHGDGFILNGLKAMVLGASAADWLIVSVQGTMGVELFLLPRARFAERLKPCRTFDAQDAADLDLNGLIVSSDDRIGGDINCLAALEETWNQAIFAACAEALGAMEAAITITAEYLNTRQQFGAPIGTFQALQHRLADMVIACEQARSILLYAASVLDSGDAAASAKGVSAAKARISQSAKYVAAQAVQLHGGIGVTEEHIISHYFRKLDAFARRWGDADFHLARFMGA